MRTLPIMLKLPFKSIAKSVAQYPAPIRLGIFITALLLIWLPIAAPIYRSLSSNPNLATILTMGLLFLEFLFLLRFWSKNVYQQPQCFKRYGLVWTSSNTRDLLKGISIGLCFCLLLFILEGVLGWIEFKTPSIALGKIIAEGCLSALGIGLAEELVFRGWILDELQQDYQPRIALWANVFIFALSHFLKPIEEVMRTLPTFPALILLGLTLVWAKQGHQNRLGICIGLHAGLIWGYYILNVAGIIEDSQTVSPWITGIDGNPIAGMMGLLFLAILAWWMRRQAIIRNS
jgi:uncharacterized protein